MDRYHRGSDKVELVNTKKSSAVLPIFWDSAKPDQWIQDLLNLHL